MLIIAIKKVLFVNSFVNLVAGVLRNIDKWYDKNVKHAYADVEQ